MTDKKLMVKSKFEKYDMFLVRPHAEGVKKLNKTHNSVKNTGPSGL